MELKLIFSNWLQTDECHGGVSVRAAGLGPVFSMTRDWLPGVVPLFRQVSRTRLPVSPMVHFRLTKVLKVKKHTIQRTAPVFVHSLACWCELKAENIAVPPDTPYVAQVQILSLYLSHIRPIRRHWLLLLQLYAQLTNRPDFVMIISVPSEWNLPQRSVGSRWHVMPQADLPPSSVISDHVTSSMLTSPLMTSSPVDVVDEPSFTSTSGPSSAVSTPQFKTVTLQVNFSNTYRKVLHVYHEIIKPLARGRNVIKSDIDMKFSQFSTNEWRIRNNSYNTNCVKG